MAMQHRSQTLRFTIQRAVSLQCLIVNLILSFFLSSSVKDSGVFRKTPPSAKQHYIKQARYFPGQKNAASGAAGGVTYGRKPSYGNVGGNTYVPSFQSSTYAAGAQNRAGGMC